MFTKKETVINKEKTDNQIKIKYVGIFTKKETVIHEKKEENKN